MHLIKFMRDKSAGYFVYLEFDRGNYQDFCYCVWIEKVCEKFNEIDALLSKYSYRIYENNDRKTYWQYFNSNRNWDSETWAKIPSGQLADEIWQEIEPMLKEVVELEL